MSNNFNISVAIVAGLAASTPAKAENNIQLSAKIEPLTVKDIDQNKIWCYKGKITARELRKPTRVVEVLTMTGCQAIPAFR